MKKLLLIGLLGFGFIQPLEAQTDWANFDALLSSGPVPVDFTEAFGSKYSKEKASTNYDSRKVRGYTEDFYTQNEYSLNNFLTSGDVTFGDSITQLCEEILDYVLADDPALRRELRVYTVKSAAVNAAANSSGILFVTTGLIAQLENEAQLAYVLAHEAIHYRNSHGLDRYLEKRRKEDRVVFVWSNEDEEVVEDLSKYSRTHELEADTEGFSEYFEKTGYRPLESYYAMDVLMYSYLPFNEVPLDPGFLAKGAAKFPSSHTLTKVAEITAEEDYDDEKSSHPNIRKRKEAILELLPDEDQGEKYILGEDRFKYAQRLARYELVRSLLEYRNYPKALYNIFLLEHTYGRDRYTRLSTLKALHGISVYSNRRGEEADLFTDFEKVEGESQQMFHLLSQMKPEEFATLAVAHAYDFLRDYPESDYAQKAFDQGMKELTVYHKLDPAELPKDTLALIDSSSVSSLDSILDNNRSRSSKIRTIKNRKAKQSISENSNYHHYAFVNFWEDTLFSNRFDRYYEASEEVENSRQMEAKIKSKGGNYVTVNKPSEFQQKDKNKQQALDLDRVLCVDPRYKRFKDKNDLKHVVSVDRRQELVNDLKDLAPMANLDLALMDYKILSSGEVEKYNQMSLLKAWVFERANHNKYPAIVSTHDLVLPLTEELDAYHLMVTGFMNNYNSFDYSVFRSLFVLPPLFPFLLANTIGGDPETYHYFYVFDLKTGDKRISQERHFSTSDRRDYRRSLIYNDLLQITSKPKK